MCLLYVVLFSGVSPSISDSNRRKAVCFSSPFRFGMRFRHKQKKTRLEFLRNIPDFEGGAKASLEEILDDRAIPHIAWKYIEVHKVGLEEAVSTSGVGRKTTANLFCVS